MCWVGRAAERCLDASSSVGGGRTPPPGPDTVCVGRTLTSVRSKKYMEKLLYVFFIILAWYHGSRILVILKYQPAFLIVLFLIR